MRQVTLGFAFAILFFSTARAEEPDSFCHLTFRASDTEAWIVDSGMNDAINNRIGSMTMTDTDAENMIDQALQNHARESRARFRTRIARAQGTCTQNDTDTTACANVFTTNVDPCVTGVLGRGGADPTKGAWFVMCAANITAGDWGSGLMDLVLTHELGHSYGLAHPDNGAGLSCSSTATNDPNDVNNGACILAGTSDGCGGELMCSTIPCQQSSFLTDGDARGLRDGFGVEDNSNRKVFFGRDALSDGVDQPSRTVTSPLRSSRYAPRIACGTSTSPTNKCAAVMSAKTASFEATTILRLNTPSGSSSWSTQAVAGTWNVESSMPPDIAVDATTQTAFVARVSNAGNVRVTKLDLSSGSLTTVLINHLTPVLPPRIAFADGSVWVLSLDFNAGSSESFGNPDWDLARLDPSTMTETNFGFTPLSDPGAVDLDGIGTDAFAPASDFDFDCKDTHGYAECTIVAMIRDEAGGHPISRPRSIKFDVFQPTSGIAFLEDGNWDYGANDANGIIGVTYGPAGDMLVSMSRPMDNGTSTANTRVTRVDGTHIGSTTVSSSAHTSDAETCTAGSNHGFSVGAATMHGGYSVAWCPSCGGTEGTLESLTWGLRSDGDSFCF